MGFPIRTSPDHSLLAASRGLSQLIASFIAYLRQGIHTHALSSLTIKSTSHTTLVDATFFALTLVFCNARQYSIVKDLDFGKKSVDTARNANRVYRLLTFDLVGLGRIELPTSPLSGVRSSQLSYRPEADTGGAGRDRTGDLLSANQALSQLSYSPKNQSRPVECRDGRDQPDRRFEKSIVAPSGDPERARPPSRSRTNGLEWNDCLLLRVAYTTQRLVSQAPPTFSLRKEVIQPQVLLRLPCYDFTPIMDHTLGRCLLAVSLQTSSTIHFRDVTGGVYKARERIHGSVLICHY